MRTPISTFERAAGVFVLVVILLTLGGFVIVARQKDLADYFRPDVRFFVLVPDGKGLSSGSTVTFKGIEIGAVEKVDLVRDSAHPDKIVRLTIAIRQKNISFLGDRPHVIIDEPLLGFGSGGVHLEPEGTGQLKGGTTMVAEDTESLDDQIRKTLSDLAGVSGQISSSLAEVQAILGNIHKITESVANGQGVVGRTLTDKQAADDMSASLANVRVATEQGKEAATHVNHMTEQTMALTQSLHDMSKRIDALVGKVDPLTSKLPEVVASVERTVKLLEATVVDVRNAAGYAPGLARKANTSIDETNRLIEAVQRNFIVNMTMSDRPKLRTEGVLRPDLSALDGGVP